MKTDDLISLLAQDAPVKMRLGRMMTYALLIGIAVSGVIMLSTIGIRHDMGDAIRTARVMFKLGLTLILAVLACSLVFRIGKPGVGLKALARALGIPLVLLAAAVAVELSVVPADLWKTSMIGRYSGYCIFFIPLLSVAPLAGFLWALHHGAPENPGIAGAAAGLAAGGVAAAIYAWHCPDDSPLFLATWYGLAISVVTLVGYFAGRRWLRW